MGGFKTFGVSDVLTASDVNNYLMRQAVVKCTSGTHPSSPAEGDVIYETDTDLLMIHNGSNWIKYAERWPLTVTDRQADEYTITGTSYGVAKSSGTYLDCGVAFVAPASGVVIIHSVAQLSNSGTSSSTWVGTAVRTGAVVGSGTDVMVADDSSAIKAVGVSATRQGVHHTLGGLTKGSSYNVRLEHRVDAGTGTIRWRGVTVQPAT